MWRWIHIWRNRAGSIGVSDFVAFRFEPCERPTPTITRITEADFRNPEEDLAMRRSQQVALIEVGVSGYFDFLLVRRSTSCERTRDTSTIFATVHPSG